MAKEFTTWEKAEIKRDKVLKKEVEDVLKAKIPPPPKPEDQVDAELRTDTAKVLGVKPETLKPKPTVALDEDLKRIGRKNLFDKKPDQMEDEPWLRKGKK